MAKIGSHGKWNGKEISMNDVNRLYDPRLGPRRMDTQQKWGSSSTEEGMPVEELDTSVYHSC